MSDSGSVSREAAESVSVLNLVLTMVSVLESA
jgi:hypothetical protein